jgi:hypothetical protein
MLLLSVYKPEYSKLLRATPHFAAQLLTHRVLLLSYAELKYSLTVYVS